MWILLRSPPLLLLLLRSQSRLRWSQDLNSYAAIPFINTLLLQPPHHQPPPPHQDGVRQCTQRRTQTYQHHETVLLSFVLFPRLCQPPLFAFRLFPYCSIPKLRKQPIHATTHLSNGPCDERTNGCRNPSAVGQNVALVSFFNIAHSVLVAKASKLICHV